MIANDAKRLAAQLDEEARAALVASLQGEFQSDGEGAPGALTGLWDSFSEGAAIKRQGGQERDLDREAA